MIIIEGYQTALCSALAFFLGHDALMWWNVAGV